MAIRESDTQENTDGTLPLISVVLPVYRQFNLLEESVNSVFDSTGLPLELIIVNDGSPNSLEDAFPHFKENRLIRCIEKEHEGLAAALNTGYALSRGCFVSWTSADNRYRPGALSKLASFLTRRPLVGMAYANMGLIDSDGHPLHGSTFRPQNQVPPGSADLHLTAAASSLGADNDNFIGACFMLRKSVVERVGLVDPALRACEDFDFWLRVSRIAEIEHIDTSDILYDYRLHDKTITATEGPERITLETSQMCQATASHFAARKRIVEIDIESAHPEARAFLKALELEEASDSLQLSETARNAVSVTFDDSGLSVPADVTLLQAEEGADTPLQRMCFRDPSVAISLSCPQLGSKAVLAPPLRETPLLLRSRDSDYRAIPQREEFELTVCIPLNSIWRESTTRWIKEFIEQQQKTLVALIATTPEERQQADSLNLSLNNNRNLRIFDLREEAKERYLFERALLFVLSACDAIVHLSELPAGLTDYLKTRHLAALAAYRNCPLIRLIGSEDFEKQLPGDIEPSLRREMLAWPHLSSISMDLGALTVGKHLKDIVSSMPYDSASLDEWIETQSKSACRQQFLDVFVAKGIVAR